MGKSKERQLVENSAFLYVMRIASYIFPLITTPYLTRVLTENNYGIYTWANAIINYARLFVDFGFVIYGVEAIARCKGDKKEIGRIVSVVIKYKMILCIITGLVLLMLCVFVAEFREHALMITISYIPSIISVFGIDYVFQGMEQMKYITIRVVITKAIFTILVFAFVRNSGQYILIPILTSVGDALSVMMMWKSARKMGLKSERESLSDGMELLKKSTWYFWSRIFGAIYTYGNIVLLGLVCPKSQVAQYSVAYTVLVVAQNFISPIAESLHPYMVKNKNFRVAKKVLLIFEPLIIGVCIIGALISEPVITVWFGEEYKTAAKLLCHMIPMIIVALPEYLFGYPMLSALGRYKEPNIAVIIAGVFHVLGYIVLFCNGEFSVFSVVYLTCLTELLVMIIRAYYLIKELSRRKIEEEKI